MSLTFTQVLSIPMNCHTQAALYGSVSTGVERETGHNALASSALICIDLVAYDIAAGHSSISIPIQICVFSLSFIDDEFELPAFRVRLRFLC